MLNFRRRNSTNGETKAALNSILEFIGDKKRTSDNLKDIVVKCDPSESDLSHGCFTDVSFAGSFAYTPPPLEEVRDCFMDCLLQEQFAVEKEEAENLSCSSAMDIKQETKVYSGQYDESEKNCATPLPKKHKKTNTVALHKLNLSNPHG